ncbi:MAG: hypothetical protein LAQ30_23670 [Acidobacteriia bacterium]|nr:hypothetical protein [Terriglobia bacterium]
MNLHETPDPFRLYLALLPWQTVDCGNMVTSWRLKRARRRTEMREDDSLRIRITAPLIFCILISSGPGFAATDVRVDFTLNTTDVSGARLRQQRFYYVYRPDNLPRTAPAPMILTMNGVPATYFHRKADEAGFVVVSCSSSGNSTGTPGRGWANHDPRVEGFEDVDYTTEVIRRVRASDHCSDAFVTGLSMGGHMALAYACERPSMIRAAASLDEFMGLTGNIPRAAVPVILFHGTSDASVAYAMVKDTVDAWRAADGLQSAVPATTYESSPRRPGQVSQATWRGGTGGTQVAFVTIIGGTHTYPTPDIETGYDFTDGIWAFFSQFLTMTQAAPKIVSQPVNNVQTSGEPASFWVAATGRGPMSYRWQKNGKDLPGATANWLTIPPTTPADNGSSFRVVVRNRSGSIMSAPAILTVKDPPVGVPTISAHPADRTAAAGQPVTFTVVAAGASPFEYQWRKNGMNIAGATAATLSIPAAILPDSGASFSVAVTNGAGSVTSRRATLSVMPAAGAPVILTNPARVRARRGQRATFSVTASSASPMSYQWQKGIGAGNMSDIPGATEAAYTTPPATLADNKTLFRCAASNVLGNATSAIEVLFVSAEAKGPQP